MLRSARHPLLVFLLLSAGRAVAADGDAGLLWPTDASRCVTSGFCEFRPGHFHSGIDISTGGRVGFSCFAAADGDIVRARVSCRGYGRALYLRLADGRTVTYAHLSAFSGALADTILARQLAQGSAYLDLEFPPGAFPVERGDVIARTGQSGAGVPHLHVEVRDPSERPMDPLFHGFAAADRAAPSVKRVMLVPITVRSSVDGGSDPVVLEVTAGQAPGARRVPHVIPVEGEIGIAVEVDETMDACRFRLSPRSVELVEGEDVLYRVEYDRFAFSETKLQDLQLEPRHAWARQGDFHLLWRRAGNTLPFVRDGRDEDGVVSAAGGAAGWPGETRRRLIIRARDAAGLAGEAEIELSFAAPPAVRSLAVRDRGDSVVVEAVAVPTRSLESTFVETSADLGETWTRVPSGGVDDAGSFEATIARDEKLLVRAGAADELGVAGVSRVLALGENPMSPASAPAFEVVTLGAWTEVRTRAVVEWRDPFATAEPWRKGTRIVLDPRSLTSARVRLEGLDPWGRVVQIAFEPPRRIGSGSTLEGPRGLARFRFGSGTFPQPAFAVVREEEAPRGEPELRPVGPLLVLDTGGLPWVGEYVVTLVPEQGRGFDEQHLGVFARDPDGFHYLTTIRGENGWTAETGTPLGVGLFEDTQAPEIGPPRFEPGDRPRLFFLARDAGAGILCDDVQVLVDGTPWVHELDDETGDVVAYPGAAPESGASGTVDVRVVDRCGNASRRQTTVVFP
ncbi:MAG: hypothetical protein ACT4PE_12900 [Candidatus Eiseniibacteriota bacterium]